MDKITSDIPSHVRQWVLSKGKESSILITGSSKRNLYAAWDSLVGSAGASDMLDLSDIVVADTDAKSLGIKEVRALLAVTGRTSLKAYRLILIPGAERLTVPASNALLKTLEEAPDSSRFVLYTQWPSRLLPTLLSRCQVWRVEGGLNVATGQENKSWWTRSRLERFRDVASLDDEALLQLETELGLQLENEGPSEELKLAFTRLRDYYRISRQGGNDKLAKEVLLASLPEQSVLLSK